MKKIFTISLTLILCGIMISKGNINSTATNRVVKELTEKYNSTDILIKKGVEQVAKLWTAKDGNENDFIEFCLKNYINDEVEKENAFLKISEYLEAMYGNYNRMSLSLQMNLHLDTGPLNFIDEMFGSYSPSTHLSDDLYNNKIAFVIALNFPHLTLEEKETLGNNRKAWAYSRLGDIFTSRVPADVLQGVATSGSDADIYISEYNIYMGHLLNNKGKKLFPEDMILLSHWNLRDEIKANYNKGKEGTEKQRMVYEVMKRIIDQNIPIEVINSGDYNWNPYNNEIFRNSVKENFTPELTVRYSKMLNNFKAMQKVDEYSGDTYIDRKFSDEMEIAVDEVEDLFDQFLSAPELKKVGKIISKRVGRKLEAYDIWYDGFKARSNLDENKLNEQTRALYPNAEALKKDLPNILLKLGFTNSKANYLSDKILVDAARGSGHAWGASMKGDFARLRTRIPASGMDYKGYNIAIHEFGHNVEQTISLYDVDYYMLNGVPNTAFTEALAFIFQKRDLFILGINDENPEKRDMDILDNIWSLYEICGVSMLDITTWKWLYAHPNATEEEFKNAVIDLSKEIWNKYFYPVFGSKDETILAIYSHMICYPLYLSAYAFGQIIEFQLEEYIADKHFATEIERIYKIGRLTPNQWMINATGNPVSVQPMIRALQSVL